jgi:hypothetical protein
MTIDFRYLSHDLRADARGTVGVVRNFSAGNRLLGRIKRFISPQVEAKYKFEAEGEEIPSPSFIELAECEEWVLSHFDAIRLTQHK